MTDPAQPVSEKWIDVSAHTAALGLASYKLEELARQLALAQTENAGHIRIEDELKAELEHERMRVVGCSVAALGNWKEGDTLHADYDCVAIRDVAKLRAKFDETQARCAELERAMRSIIDAPGGGPAKRIAIMALGDGKT